MLATNTVPQRRRLAMSVALAAAASCAHSDTRLEEIEVTGRLVNLVGEASTTSEGIVSGQEIALRPLLRTGDVLELVPGMVVTQHSGTGKANQYFLRGFNLDHGTDFATYVDGMPVNMRTHAHGQGYTDLNFIIPETIASLVYKKGPYYADISDFSSAGSAQLSTTSRYDKGFAELAAGGDAFYRGVVANSAMLGEGTASYALELSRYDGPWSDLEEDVRKANLLFKYGWNVARGIGSVSFMAYDNQWNSPDQIPARAVERHLIDDLGSIDDTVGGESSRYSLSARWTGQNVDVSAYAIRYKMNLWSNFTYFLDDEVNGDQFEQEDDRWIYGGRAHYEQAGTLGGMAMVNRAGAEVRYDDINEVGLYRTVGRERLGAVRSDRVSNWSTGFYGENQLAWSSRVRTVLGLRYDYFDFDVDSLVARNINDVDLSRNNGQTSDDKVSLKGSVIYSFSEQLEAYLSAGQGLHSNDARGTTTTVDPADGSATGPVDPLVESLGYEVGLRGSWNERFNASIALWSLRLDSELLFVGDAGNTEASGESKRQGVELTSYYRLTDQWTLDMEYVYTDAKFTDAAASEDQIPGAIEQVVQAGVSLDVAGGWFGSLRLRYFGKRPLVEDGSVESDASTVLNLRAGYRTPKWTVKLDVLNLLDSDDHDIDYFYASRLPGEVSGGVEDMHYHVLEPRTVRVYASYMF